MRTDYLVEDFEDRNWVLLLQAGRGRRATMAVLFLDLIILFCDGAVPLTWPLVDGPLFFLFIFFIFLRRHMPAVIINSFVSRGLSFLSGSIYDKYFI